MLGTTFASYSVHERINHGGMADIYLVTDQNAQKFALRLLLPEYRFNWGVSRRFRWGCEVERKLDHPNVVHCYETGKFRGRRYAILEYVDGANLKERILRSDPLLVAQRLKLLTGMAAGLAHIHERGFLHLDFKPENIIISRTGEPKIVDFDLSIPRPNEPKRASKLSGTPSYLAPEQILRQPLDERADIFAFGLVSYELLTGKKPITGDTREEVMQKYADFNQYLKPLRAYLPDVPPMIERVVLKCLERDMTRRYPSMSLVVRDLQT